MSPLDRDSAFSAKLMVRHLITAAYLGSQAVSFSGQGREDFAYHAARLSWKWATWALEDMAHFGIEVPK